MHLNFSLTDGVWKVGVEYILRKPQGGLIFAGLNLPGQAPPHCHTDGQWGGSRMWFPTVEGVRKLSFGPGYLHSMLLRFNSISTHVFSSEVQRRFSQNL